MADEKRVDPATGDAITFKELSASYAKKYKKSEIKDYWEDECKPPKRERKPRVKAAKDDAKPEPKAKAKAKAKAEPKAKAKAKAEPKAKAKAAAKSVERDPDEGLAPVKGFPSGKDAGAGALAKLKTFTKCVLAEYVWLDAKQVPRSKTMTMTSRPSKVSDLRVWNYDGSSTEQADGHNSEVLLKPRAIFNDPFRGPPHVLVMADCWNAWDDKPAIGNTRAECAANMTKYKQLDPWFGIEQEYTLMVPGKVGEKATVPLGFNKDGSAPAPQGPYYTSAGFGVAIGRPIADEHYTMCMEAGVKISGINAEVMPGQWEYQIGPCRGVEIGDHMTMARYIMLRVTEKHGVVCSIDPKPAEGDWNGAGCHTNFSTASMRAKGGYDVIIKICEAFGKVVKQHVQDYGEDNHKRLTGKHETCDINTFKYGVANRAASIRIPRDAEKDGRGYMEDRRPGANCDPYRVCNRIIITTGECMNQDIVAEGGAKHAAFVFIKPHAVYDKVKDLVKEKLAENGITIKSEGQIKAETIDKKKLIDVHYGAIAAKAVMMKPSELTVQEKAQKEFETQFGVAWSKVMEEGLVYNAMDAAKKLDITADELGEKYDQLKKGETIIKFGGGFYCGKVDGIYVINGFYMSMRGKFTAKGTSIYYYEVEWPADKLAWSDFRGKVLGGTDPATAPGSSLRNIVYSKWEELGLQAQPDTGDNGVHASASPFEALAERCNWLRASVGRDSFGKALLASDISMKTIKDWSQDPLVEFEGGKKSLFDLMEDLDGSECLKKAAAIEPPDNLPRLIQQDGLCTWCASATMADEKRVDPATGDAITFKELSASYAKKYKKSEIKAYWEDYWEDECKPPKRERKPRVKAAKDTEDDKPEPKAKAKAKAEPKAKAKAKAEPKAKAKAAAKSVEREPVEDLVQASGGLHQPWPLMLTQLPPVIVPLQDGHFHSFSDNGLPAAIKVGDLDCVNAVCVLCFASLQAPIKGVRSGKDAGAGALAKLKTFTKCVLAEYVWLDAKQVPRSKTMTMTSRPSKVSDLRVWNYDGSSTEQADGHNSEVLLKPRAIFNDPFRGPPHVLVLADAWNAWDDKPAIGNTRAECAANMTKYSQLDPWFGIEQEYTLMRPGKVGEKATVPLGFNEDGSAPAPQGPYYTSAGFGVAIGRPIADEHYALCIEAGVKISGINAEVMPGQWEYQIGPCRGVEIGDHMTMARYIMLRLTEKHGVVCSIDPKPAEGDWNGAGCHTNFSTASMRAKGGYDVIIKICEAFGKVVKQHVQDYGEDNHKRLTGKHETCDINTFKYGVANRAASIRIPRDAEKDGRGYMEDRRPGANCDPYRVCNRIIITTGECMNQDIVAEGGAKHAAFVFIKPHAVYDKVKDLVKEKLAENGITIKSEGQIKAETIDKKKLIDVHYGAIAAKAVMMKPSELTVQEKAQKEFETQFGVAWSKVMEEGLVYNAMDAAKKLEITADELGEKYDQLKKGETIIKFGGGFYCGKVDGIYVINGFYMSMRGKFTAKGTSIYYYEVEWPADKLAWSDFRGKVLGGTDPATAPGSSLRNIVYSKWEELGLQAQPDTGDNGVHASASPFEALAERCNWLRASIGRDSFGKALLASDISTKTIKDWSQDPLVEFEGGKKSLFDLMEDLDGSECLKKAAAIAAANK
ncbi:unnamed protein product [Polarella glacialis]|uniref:Glutamine synthetase n=1 Tax=Polarella glacialis TaxID=89957 RepID=A0A813L0H4_POLGL|nr:unnamed protein product [Polarella glacialis]